MNRATLIQQIRHKRSFLCVGLDTDVNKIPEHLRSKEDPIFEFNKGIIDRTKDLVVAYKPNTAFYESRGPQGMESLRKTIEYIPDDILVIADAKRGDIGNTSRMYAQSFFDYYKADALTVAPYMGSDSVSPFLEYPYKWVIILGLTSNGGSMDFQQLSLADGGKLYEKVIEISSSYGTADNIMYVVGATQTDYISQIRKIVPDHFFLVPGVGAQGGNLQNVCQHGLNQDVGLIINSSRSIIYAGSGENYADAARSKCMELQAQMETILSENNLL